MLHHYALARGLRPEMTITQSKPPTLCLSFAHDLRPGLRIMDSIAWPTKSRRLLFGRISDSPGHRHSMAMVTS